MKSDQWSDRLTPACRSPATSFKHFVNFHIDVYTSNLKIMQDVLFRANRCQAMAAHVRRGMQMADRSNQPLYALQFFNDKPAAAEMNAWTPGDTNSHQLCEKIIFQSPISCAATNSFQPRFTRAAKKRITHREVTKVFFRQHCQSSAAKFASRCLRQLAAARVDIPLGGTRVWQHTQESFCCCTGRTG